MGAGDGEQGRDGGGGGGRGGCWIVSRALRFVFSFINLCMSSSCCCLEAFKSASVFFHKCSINSQISHIVDVSTCGEHADELGSLLLVATILWP